MRRLLALVLATLSPLTAQQLQFAPDQSRDAASLFGSVGAQLTLADLDGDGFADAISGPGGVTAHLQQPSLGTWLDRGIAAASQFALADMDRDGDLDLVVALDNRSGQCPFTVFHNDGTGQFQPSGTQTLFRDETFVSIVAGDLDGDGDADLLVGTFNAVTFAHRLHHLVNNGAGGLSLLATWTTSFGTRPALGDFDGDGDLDALVALPSAPPRYLENTAGTLAFRAGFLPNDPLQYSHFLPFDADRDGDLDALGRTTDGSVVLLVNGGGALTRGAALAGTWDQVVLGDFDGDGTIDAATRRDRAVTIHHGAGNGSFQGTEILRRSLQIEALAAGDLHGDRIDDLVTVWDGATRSLVVPVFGTARGMVVDPHIEHGLQLDAGPVFPLAVGDVDGDGRNDVVLAVNGNNLPRALSVQRNLGSRRFAATRIEQAATDTPLGIQLADLDRDGDLDLLERGRGSHGSYVRVSMNTGGGSFVERGAIAGAGGATAVGDVDGDGSLDLISSEFFATLHRNDGSGGFGPAITLPSSGWTAESRAIGLGDLDGDGDLDIVSPQGSPNLDVLLNDGTGTFSLAPSSALPWSASPWGLALVDVDRDGDLDVFLFQIPDNQPRLFLNNGQAQFTEGTATHLPAWSANAAQILDLVVLDLDADGDQDLLILQIGEQRLYQNNGAGRYADVTQQLWERVSAFNGAGAATDLDGDGDVDVVFAGRVQWNHQRELSAQSLPRVGGAANLRAVQDPGFAGAGSAMIGILAFAPLPTPVSIPGITGRLQLDVSGVVVTAALSPSTPAGISAWSLAIPRNADLVDLDLHFQGLALSPSHGLGFTNAVFQRILP